MIDVGILLQNADIGAVLNAIGIDYERRQSKRGYELYFACFTGKHPEENNAKTMSISESGQYKGMYNCWACSEQGNLIHMLRTLGSIDFMQAVAYLERDYGSAEVAGQKGLDFRLKMFKGESEEERELPTFELPRDYQPILSTSGSHAECVRVWLRGERHISDEAMQRFEIGICEHPGIGPAVVIPVYFRGKIRSVFYAQPFKGGLKRYPKNSPQGEILFNYDACLPVKRYIMMESILDVIKVWSLTGEDCMACFTNMISDEQLELLRPMEEHGVMPDLDGDRGWDLVLRMQPSTGKGLWLYFPTIGKDPGDCTPEEIATAIAQRTRYCDYESAQHLAARVAPVHKITHIYKT